MTERDCLQHVETHGGKEGWHCLFRGLVPCLSRHKNAGRRERPSRPARRGCSHVGTSGGSRVTIVAVSRLSWTGTARLVQLI